MRIKYLIQRFFEEGSAVGLQRIKYRILSPAQKASTARWLGRYRGKEPSDSIFFRDLGFHAPEEEKDLLMLIEVLDESLQSRGWYSREKQALVDHLGNTHPQERQATIARADAILAGDLSWLVPGGPKSTTPPPWHRAYGKKEGESWPLIPPSEFSVEDTPGDVRISWEIGRHQYLIYLAQAWLYTRNPTYGKAVITHIHDWLNHNPFGEGIHWWHAQEAALRIKAWLWALGAVLDCPDIPPGERLRIYKSLWQHTHFVLRTRSAAPMTHNHLLSELFGASHFVMTFPRFGLSRAWENRLQTEIDTEIKKQFWEDGSPGEGSVNYHLFVLESAIEWTAQRDRLSLPIRRSTRRRIAAMTRMARSWIRPDGSWPQVGDTDSGRGFRLSTEASSSRWGTLDAACRCMNIAPPDPSRVSPETLWLMGEAFSSADRNTSSPEITTGTPMAGICGIHGHGAHSSHLTFATGPLALRKGVSRAHLHAHALSVSWWVDGREILIDPGTGHYNLSLEERFSFRKTCAHSTLAIDGVDQFDVTSQRFGVGRPPLSRVVERQEGDGWFWLGATVPAATSGPAQSMMLERHAIHIPSWPSLLLIDHWCGEYGEISSMSAPLQQWFQLGNLHGQINEDGSGAIFMDAENTPIAAFHLMGAASLEKVNPDTGNWGPGYRSPIYGATVPGEALCAAHDGKENRGATSPVAIAPVGSTLILSNEGRTLLLSHPDGRRIAVDLDSKGLPLDVSLSMGTAQEGQGE